MYTGRSPAASSDWTSIRARRMTLFPPWLRISTVTICVHALIYYSARCSGFKKQPAHMHVTCTHAYAHMGTTYIVNRYLNAAHCPQD
jgi:hypothetical protein